MSERQTKAGNLQNLQNLQNLTLLTACQECQVFSNFCFHVYAQKSLFIAEICNAFFLTAAATSPSPVSLEVIELVPS